MKLAPRLAILAALFILSGPLAAKDLFVDQKSPAADDPPKADGTEAKPFKTIQPATEAAGPGDTIWVKAGLYQDPVHITNRGRPGNPITLGAWKEDRVVIGYPPQPLPAEGKWQAMPNSKCFQLKLNKDVPDDVVLILDGKPLNTHAKDTPPPEDKSSWMTYRKSDRTLMFNSNGKDPSTLGKLEFSRWGDLTFFLDWTDWWVIRGLEFQWRYNGIHLVAFHSVVEDCFFHNIYGPTLSIGSNCTIRRCNFYKCGGALWGNGQAPILEENLIVDCGSEPEEDIRNDGSGGEFGGGPTCFKGNILGMVFAYNILADCHGGAGWYMDCDGKSCRIIGNAFWSCGGIYNEAKVDDSLVMGNYFHKCGLSSSACRRLNVVDNFFDEDRVVWHNRDWGLDRYSYMLLRGNAFFNPPPPYLSGGWGRTSPYPESFRQCMVDYNRVWTKPGTMLIDSYGSATKKSSIEEIRKDLHWEEHGEVLPLGNLTAEDALARMGGSRVTFRVPWGPRSGESRPMLSYSKVENPWPSLPDDPTDPLVPGFFWRVADGNYDVTELNHGYINPGTGRYWRPDSGAGYDVGDNCGCSWQQDSELVFPDEICKLNPDKSSYTKWNFPNTWSKGKRWLVMKGVTKAKIPAQGVGYWSPHLATAAGAKISVSMKLRGKGLLSDGKGSPCVWVEFTNATGRNRQRAFLVGKDDQGTMHHAEFTTGDYDWKDLKETVTAPEGAIRMALFFGVRPCTGEVDFYDINLQTQGEAGGGATEILPPHVPLERFRQTVPIDLSKVANRALADDEDDDGKGGWTDQGPGADMRALPTGEQRLGGVLFKIAEGPRSIVVLKNQPRSKGDLPAKVTIPIGRKLDTLFFLHAGAWCNTDLKEFFHYVIHYADGKDVTLTVGPQNLRDWIGEPVARFPLEQGTFSTVAATVRVTQFGHGSVYRMEWSASPDRRPVEIKSIEFASEGKAVPVLLGITGVLEW